MERQTMLTKFFKDGVQYRFLKSMSLILIAGTCVLSTAIAINEGSMLRHSLRTKGQSFASYIAKLGQDPLIMKDLIQLDSIVNEANKDEDFIYAIIRNAQGDIVTSQYASIDYRSLKRKNIFAEISKEGDFSDVIAAINKSGATMEVSAPIRTGDDLIGTVTICMSERNIQKQITRTILFVIVLNMTVTFVLGYVLFIASKKTILGPIIELGHAADRFAKGDLSTHVDIEAAGEIRMLVDSFNKMAGDLEKTTVSKKTLQKILDSMPYAVILIDTKKKILSANHSALILMGYEVEDQVAGMTCTDTLCPAEEDKCPILDLKQELDRSERILVTKDGKRVPILKTVVPLKLDGKDVLLEAIVDITELKRAEEDLKKSEEEAKRFAQENATMAEIGRIIGSTLNIDEIYGRFAEKVREIIHFDRITINAVNTRDNTHTIQYVSGMPVPGRQIGEVLLLAGTFSETAVRARSSQLLNVGNKEERLRQYPSLIHTIKAGIQTMLLIPLISKNEVIAVLHLRSTRPNAYTERDMKLAERVGNQIASAIVNAQLFKERKQAEEQLKEYAEKLQLSNAELQDFAYIASHDLQEPLRKVTAFGERLKVKFGDTLDEQGRDYLERMRNAAVRMQTLINGLLMYSRVSTKAQPFERVDLAVVANEVLSDLEIRIEQVQGRVELGDLPTILADPLQMRQLFQNLIGNALKFHAQGNAPFIKVTSQRIAGEHQGPDGNGRPGESWQITVQDNGIGFDEKHVDRIFGVFQRLQGRSEYEGSGIGLAICRKIVQRHGGVITAKSAPGTGAAFIVTLPVSNNTQEGT